MSKLAQTFLLMATLILGPVYLIDQVTKPAHSDGADSGFVFPETDKLAVSPPHSTNLYVGIGGSSVAAITVSEKGDVTFDWPEIEQCATQKDEPISRAICIAALAARRECQLR